MKKFLTLLVLLASMTMNAASSMGENHEICIYNPKRGQLGQKTAYEISKERNLELFLKAPGQVKQTSSKEQ